MSRDTVIARLTFSGTDLDMLVFAVDSHLVDIETTRDDCRQWGLMDVVAQADEEHAAYSELLDRLRAAQ